MPQANAEERQQQQQVKLKLEAKDVKEVFARYNGVAYLVGGLLLKFMPREELRKYTLREGGHKRKLPDHIVPEIFRIMGEKKEKCSLLEVTTIVDQKLYNESRWTRQKSKNPK